jgi:malonate-semialdehyde dehydrogenase (acetylating) / methylmalonate-semialdehyde dehydrogenase
MCYDVRSVGVNVGVPVPREPFSFGGLAGTHSKYGEGDITGDAGLEFFTARRKVTTRWPTVVPTAAPTASGGDAASFVGQM